MGREGRQRIFVCRKVKNGSVGDMRVKLWRVDDQLFLDRITEDRIVEHIKVIASM